MSDTITVIKNDHSGAEILRYAGRVLERGPDYVLVEARFSLERVEVGPMVFEAGDRMLEWFYAARWYNIFEIHHHATDALKGWYCNITRPAVIEAGQVAADDLALDVLITPGGGMMLDDEDEYAALPLREAERQAAEAAVAELRQRVGERHPPFDSIR